MATEPPPSPEVIEMMSANPRRSISRPGAARDAHRRALLALPVAALLVSAGCASGSNDQASDQATGAEQQTVTATVTAPTGSTPTENTQTGNAPATDRFDPANCDTDRTGQNITGDVVVRSGQTCLLSDLTVNGDLDVHHDGRLELRGVRVAEDVEAEGHAFVLVSGGEVSGSIELDQGGEAVVENVRIGGTLESEQSSGPQRFEGNTIGGDLECEDNAHVPTGGGNQVAGEREGQCAAL